MNQEIDQLQKFTVEEFQADFDNLMDRVEKGESFLITSEYGNAVIVPYKEVIDIMGGVDLSIPTPSDDDLLKIYKDHEEGC